MLKHLIQSSPAEDLKNTLLAQVTTLQDPTGKITAHVPQQKMHVTPASALRSCKSTRPKRPPQRLQTSTSTTRARSSSRSKRVTKPKGLTTGSKRPHRSLKSTKPPAAAPAAAPAVVMPVSATAATPVAAPVVAATSKLAAGGGDRIAQEGAERRTDTRIIDV